MSKPSANPCGLSWMVVTTRYDSVDYCKNSTTIGIRPTIMVSLENDKTNIGLIWHFNNVGAEVLKDCRTMLARLVMTTYDGQSRKQVFPHFENLNRDRFFLSKHVYHYIPYDFKIY